MITMSRAIGTRLLDALVPQKTASAGCSPDCWCIPVWAAGQRYPCYTRCCYTPSCGTTCTD